MAGGATLSLRLRLTLLFALVTSLSIGAVGAFLDYSLSAQLAAREREQLLGKLELFRYLLSEVNSPAEIFAERNRFSDVLVAHGDLRAAILSPSGAHLLALSDFVWPEPLIAAAARGEEVEGELKHENRAQRLLIAPASLGKATQPPQLALVALAHDAEDSREILYSFRTTIVLAFVLGSLVAGGLGYFAASRGLGPLRRVVRTAKEISAERLNERLEVKDVPSEVRDLAESFNGMLARLESSFRKLSDFSSDLAHELRTPLTNLMLHAQVALDKPRTEGELRTVLEASLEELQRLSRTVNDMLFLAKADHAQIRLSVVSFQVEDEVEKILEYFEPLASEQGIALEREGSALASADRDMVRRVLANLVSNAVRHADAHSRVKVRIVPAAESVAVQVENDGASLSTEDTERVFDRFFRAETSRSAASEGAGLGLAIVKSIMELHGGEVAAESSGTKTVFRVTFPKPRTLGAAG